MSTVKHLGVVTEKQPLLFSHLVAPFKVGVAHERPISEFTLEEIVNIFRHSLSQDGVQFGEILGGLVVLRVVGEDVLRGLAKRAVRLVDALVLDGDGEVVAGALLATLVLATWHLHDLSMFAVKTAFGPVLIFYHIIFSHISQLDGVGAELALGG